MQAVTATRRTKASPAQLSYLAEYMQSHPNMASGMNQTLQGRVKLEKSWNDLAKKLNSLGGAEKTVVKWKQAWRDMKNNVKKKVAAQNNELQSCDSGSTCNGPTTVKEVSVEDDEIISSRYPVAVYGTEEAVCTEPTTEVPSHSPASKIIILAEPESETEEKPQKMKITRPPIPATKRRRRVIPRHDSFDTRLLQLEEEKIKVKREQNRILEEKNSILDRLVEALVDIKNNLN